MTNIDEKKRYSMKKVTEITWKNSWQINYYIKKWFIKKDEYMKSFSLMESKLSVADTRASPIPMNFWKR